MCYRVYSVNTFLQFLNAIIRREYSQNCVMLSCLGTLSGIMERVQTTLSAFLCHITVLLVPTKLRWNLDKEKI